jgi:N-acetyl-alpha-D-muramate 1-phosphate uridylyltransferase
MSDSLAAVVLAAGIGERLRPLTLLRPKPLCPVGDVALVDHALVRVAEATADVAVNVHAGRAAMEEHLAGRVHVSVEDERPLGTAGALGQLREWLDGRAALVVNADAWCPGSLAGFVLGWDGERIRMLLVGDDQLRSTSRLAGVLMPWSDVAPLEAVPSGLYEGSWRQAAADGRVEVVRHDGPFIDCGTPADYLAANLATSGGASVIGPGAVVEGTVERSVVWPGAHVHASEHLVDAIRADGLTVLVR